MEETDDTWLEFTYWHSECMGVWVNGQ